MVVVLKKMIKISVIVLLLMMVGCSKDNTYSDVMNNSDTNNKEEALNSSITDNINNDVELDQDYETVGTGDLDFSKFDGYAEKSLKESTGIQETEMPVTTETDNDSIYNLETDDSGWGKLF